MTNTPPLTPEQLYRACDPESLPFLTTAELDDLTDAIGQSRATEALHFGVGMRHEGYNLFVLGSTGLGKHTVVRRELEARASESTAPADWCYVNDFDQPHRPRSLRLPAGTGQRLRRDVEHLIEDLLNAIPAAFQSDDYRARAQEINDELKERQEQAFAELDEKAQERGITILRTPTGYTLAPMKDGEILGPEDFGKLPETEQKAIEEKIDALRKELREVIRSLPIWQRETRAKFKRLNQEVTQLTVDQLMASIFEQYAGMEAVSEHLKAVEQDVVENADAFRQQGEEEGGAHPNGRLQGPFTRYQVNVLVDNAKAKGAPVVYEDNPTYQNLIGRVEHIAQMGTLITDFTLIKPGALHKANGGYLLLDVRKLLMHPYAWEGLKRALRSRELRLESLEQMLSLVSTVSLEPEPIPIDVKVVLMGERLLYYLLKEYDPEFGLLFKVAADFAEDMDRSAEAQLLHARLIATVQRRESLRPLDRGGVARVIEQSARRAGDGEKLSLHMGGLTDLLREADYWAAEAGSDVVRAEHVRKAVDSQIHRVDQIRERVQEVIERGVVMIDTEGERVAQINGLAVTLLGDYSFGRPSRITATARMGKGDIIDIEREVKLGGAIHSKGVLILSAFLANRYAQDRPLSLSATLVFEQSYGRIDGDSASAAELCTLISALGGIPIRQSFAVTGSVNQHGEVQAIGGVNEKIEGFFDLCQARGLTGEQGVIVPRSNRVHLMLRPDIVEACEAGRFAVYAVDHVDAMLELLTGLSVGEADGEGRFPADSINGRVQARLEHWFEARRHIAAQMGGEKSREGGNHGQEDA